MNSAVTPSRLPSAVPEGPRRGIPGLLAGITALAAVGLAAGGTAGALLATELAGTASVAGLPVALHLGGSAAGALLVSQQAGRGHRGRGLALGLLLGALGALVVIVAAEHANLPGMLVGSTLLGTANSSIFLLRYAAAQAASEGNRGRALGAVFLATAVGATVSPLLLGPGGSLAQMLQLPALCGMYLIALAAFGSTALLLAVASTPRTPVLGAAARVLTTGVRSTRGGADLLTALRGPSTVVALSALAATNFVMVGVMTITPVHLAQHGSGNAAVGFLVALHVVAMFAPAPITGRLADRHGPLSVVLTGSSIALVACVAGALGDGHATALTTTHLVLAGLGWNCGVVGSSSLLTEAVPVSLRPHVEGIGEATMGTAAVLAAPLAAALPGRWGYHLLGLCAVALTLLCLARMRRIVTDVPTRPQGR